MKKKAKFIGLIFAALAISAAMAGCKLGDNGNVNPSDSLLNPSGSQTNSVSPSSSVSDIISPADSLEGKDDGASTSSQAGDNGAQTADGKDATDTGASESASPSDNGEMSSGSQSASSSNNDKTA